MKIKPLQLNCRKSRLIFPLVIILSLQGWLVNSCLAAGSNAEAVYNDKIARGITLQKNMYTDYQGKTGNKESEYIITADLNDSTVNVISGKAGDKVLKLDTVSSQIATEQARGQNVVAGINGDMFNISIGTMHYGTPQGLQVKDGNIIVGFETIGSGPRFPVFAIDKNRRGMIAYLSMDAGLSVIDPAYEAAHGSPNPELTTSINTINRNNTDVMNDQMILETPQLAENPVVGFTDAQAANGILTVLKNISGGSAVKLGKEYTAEVVSIGDTATGSKSITVPADGMVLASQGSKAAWVKEHLKAGSRIRFSFNLKDQSGKPLDLTEAVTAWLPLVENGKALTQAEMLDKCKNDWDHGTAVINAKDKARTAIGITGDNKVVALVFDGGGAAKESYGIDLPSLAERMSELGAVAAVSLDGGGSTQMNTRLFGENNVQVINRPSDVKERPITNSILLVSNAAKTNDVNELKLIKDINIYKNGTYTFQLRGSDRNGNPADLSKADVKWSIQPGDGLAAAELSGSIDQTGLFKAGEKPAVEKVCATVGSVTGSARVNVVDIPYQLAFTDSGVLAVEPTVPRQINLAAYTQEGQPIIMPNNTVQWSVAPSQLASIDANGLLTPLGKGQGTVTARIGNKEASITFVSGLEPQVIDGFETGDLSSYSVNGFIGGTCQLVKTPVKDGQYSLKVDYDYSKWAKVYNGTINVQVDAAKKGPGYTTYIRPKKLGMWIYGDGKAPWLRAMLKDGYGNQRMLNLASNINWVGWKYVDVVIPEDIPTPITLDYFYMVETDKSKSLKGTVYFDGICFTYKN